MLTAVGASPTGSPQAAPAHQVDAWTISMAVEPDRWHNASVEVEVADA